MQQQQQQQAGGAQQQQGAEIYTHESPSLVYACAWSVSAGWGVGVGCVWGGCRCSGGCGRQRDWRGARGRQQRRLAPSTPAFTLTAPLPAAAAAP